MKKQEIERIRDHINFYNKYGVSQIFDKEEYKILENLINEYERLLSEYKIDYNIIDNHIPHID